MLNALFTLKRNGRYLGPAPGDNRSHVGYHALTLASCYCGPLAWAQERQRVHGGEIVQIALNHFKHPHDSYYEIPCAPQSPDPAQSQQTHN
jgi:hypothetical protein